MSQFLPICLVLILAGCSDTRDPLGPSQTQGAAVLSDALRPGSDASLESQGRLKPYGTVDYVPGVGPVASYERAYVSPGTPLDPGQYDQTIRLVATAAGPPIP